MAALDEDRPVRFGEFVLDPAEAMLVGPDGPVRIGRKAFRLLEALVAHPGSLLTKERLFETVWDGTIVSESALTATVKELRRALRDEARNARFIENVYGRGYRFVASVAPEARAPPSAPADDPLLAPPSASHAQATEHSGAISRRALIGWGAAGAAAAVAGAFAIPRLLRPATPPEVVGLIASARELLDQNTRVGHNQAIGLLRRVTALAPEFADGWGLLGMAYGVTSHFCERPEGLMLRARARAAGDRALELDPGNASGEIARAVELPFIGHWRERDRRLARALADAPGNEDALEFIAITRQFNGCSSAALPLYARLTRRPFTPGIYGELIRTLWSAGRIEEAERTLDDAVALYPTQATLWFERFDLMLYGGRPEAAAALAMERDGRPTGFDDALAAELRTLAEAVRVPSSPAARRTLARLHDQARREAWSAETAIKLGGAVRDLDAAFAIADAYYFSRGFAVPDTASPGSAASTDQRLTSLLFEPETAALRADPRFERLMEEIGLDGYWRQAGVVPDYRARRLRSG